MIRTVSFLIAMILIPLPVLAQDIPGLRDKARLECRIDQLLHQIMEAYELPGLAFGIVVGQDIVLSKGYGVRNINSQEPVTDESLFHMASVSKPFVATALVQFVEDDLIDLDDPVVDYLSYFTMDDPRVRDITIQQMLSHTSGMPDTDDYGWDRPAYDDGAAERYVRSLADETLIYDPGTDWGYSNIAFEVLGDVIAKVSGMPFERYVKTRILDPAGMLNSTFLKSEVADELSTSPHIWTGRLEVSKVYPYHRAHAPSSTLHSNVREMCNWAIVNMNFGEINGQRIVNPESYDLLWNEYTRGIGLSWFFGRFNGMRTIRHGGGDTGYASEFVIIPEDQVGVVVFSNSDIAPVWEMSRIILGILYGHGTEVPLTPVLIPLGGLLANGDMSDLAERYRYLEKNSANEYIFGEDQLSYLGSSLLIAGRIDQAINVFKANLRLFPESPDILYHLGRAYLHAGERDLAVEYIESSLALDPENVNAKRLLATLK